jgi:hypothetical protein
MKQRNVFVIQRKSLRFEMLNKRKSPLIHVIFLNVSFSTNFNLQGDLKIVVCSAGFMVSLCCILTQCR